MSDRARSRSGGRRSSPAARGDRSPRRDDGERGGGYRGNNKAEHPRTIFVAGLATEVTVKDLERLFSEAGFKTADVDIPIERSSGQHKGFGFVCLDDERDVDDACAKLTGDTLRGREIKCEPKKSRPPRRDYGGGYGGGYGGRGGYGGWGGRGGKGRGRGDSRGRPPPRRYDSRGRGPPRGRHDSRRRY